MQMDKWFSLFHITMAADVVDESLPVNSSCILTHLMIMTGPSSSRHSIFKSKYIDHKIITYCTEATFLETKTKCHAVTHRLENLMPLFKMDAMNENSPVRSLVLTTHESVANYGAN